MTDSLINSLLNFSIATPDGIEDQEAQSQQILIQSTPLRSINIFYSLMMRDKLQKPVIEPDSDRQLRATCCQCRYWSGMIGNEKSDLICAVNVPRPTEAELDAVNHRLAYTLHNCPDFEEKPQSASCTIQLH